MPGGERFGQDFIRRNAGGVGAKKALGEIDVSKGNTGNLVGVRGTVAPTGTVSNLVTEGSPVEAGVLGFNTEGNAVVGITNNGIGVYGEAGPDGLACHFKGRHKFDGPCDHLDSVEFHGDVKHNQNMHVVGGITVDGDVILTNPGGDVAEEFVVDDAVIVDPGTVLVIGDEGMLCPTTCSYDTRVAGVVAGAGRFRPAIILDRQEGESRMVVSRVGKAYCKVDAEYGPIKAGDLLTTSPTQGHAMRVDEPSKAVGAIIGKALGLQESGRGLIPILLTLQ